MEGRYTGGEKLWRSNMDYSVTKGSLLAMFDIEMQLNSELFPKIFMCSSPSILRAICQQQTSVPQIIKVFNLNCITAGVGKICNSVLILIKH